MSEPEPPSNEIRQDDIGEVRVSESGSNAAEPAVATDTSGNIYTVYVEHSEDQKADLYLQKFDSALDRSGEKVRVNAEIGVVKSWRGDPPTVVIAPDKTIFVGWTRRSGNRGTDYVLSASRDGGMSFSEPTKINDDEAPASHGMHSLTVDRNGTVFAAWLDERNVPKTHSASLPPDSESSIDEGFRFVKIDHKAPEAAHSPEPNSEVFFALSNDGGKTFSKNQRIARDVCPCCKTSVLAIDDGRVYVSWRQVLEGDYRHIAVAVSTNHGQTFSPGSIVSDDRWQIAACPVSGAAITSAPDTGIDVVWYTAGSAGIAGYYSAGSKGGSGGFTSRKLISDQGVSGNPILIAANSGLILVIPASDDRAIITRQTPDKSSFSISSTIERASVPAATASNDAAYVAFVRNENKKASVWIAKR